MYSQQMLNSIIQGLVSSENDLQFHKLNLERFEAITNDETLDKESDFAKKLLKEIPVLRSRIAEVELVIKHTNLQLETAGYTAEQIETAKQEVITKTENV